MEKMMTATKKKEKMRKNMRGDEEKQEIKIRER